MFQALREMLTHEDAVSDSATRPRFLEVMVPVSDPSSDVHAVALALDMAGALGGFAQIVGLYDEEAVSRASPASEATAARRHRLAQRLTLLAARLGPHVPSRVWVTHRRDVEGLVEAFGADLVVLRAAEAPRLESPPSLGFLLVPDEGVAPGWLEMLGERAHGLLVRPSLRPSLD